MAKQVTINGNFEWIIRNGKRVGVEWVDDPNGKFILYRIKYNWFDRLLIWFRPKNMLKPALLGMFKHEQKEATIQK